MVLPGEYPGTRWHEGGQIQLPGGSSQPPASLCNQTSSLNGCNPVFILFSPENDAPLPLDLLLTEGAVGQDVRENLHGTLHVPGLGPLAGALEGHVPGSELHHYW